MFHTAKFFSEADHVLFDSCDLIHMEGLSILALLNDRTSNILTGNECAFIIYEFMKDCT